MNSYVVVFAALILAVHGGSIRVARQSDGGWGAPPPPTIEIELEGAAAASTDGGIAEASQDLSASAVGTVENPAEIALVAGTEAELEQSAALDQIGIADLLNLSSTSINIAVAGNLASANDNLFGSVIGGQSASLANSGASQAAGIGLSAIEAIASSSNVINN